MAAKIDETKVVVTTHYKDCVEEDFDPPFYFELKKISNGKQEYEVIPNMALAEEKKLVYTEHYINFAIKGILKQVQKTPPIGR